MSIWEKKKKIYKAENFKSTGIFGSLVILISTRQQIFQKNKYDTGVRHAKYKLMTTSL